MISSQELGEPSVAVGARDFERAAPLGVARREVDPARQQVKLDRERIIARHGVEKLRGVIEWYDKHCLKINRVKEPNLLVPKHNIKYIYKQDEEPRIRRSRTTKKEEVAADVDMGMYD